MINRFLAPLLLTLAVGVSASAQPLDTRPGWENSREYFQAMVGDTVWFRADRADLTPQAQAALKRQVAWLHAHPSYAIRLSGHTDERCAPEYCLALGERMAQSVKDFMVAQGLDHRRIATQSFGKFHPADPGRGAAARDRNRRVETVLDPSAP